MSRPFTVDIELSMKHVRNSSVGTLILCLWAGVIFVAQGTDAACFPAIFNFGDDDGDTGGIHASFPYSTAAEEPPYGMTYFGVPQGRNSDGRLIIDFMGLAGCYEKEKLKLLPWTTEVCDLPEI